MPKEDLESKKFNAKSLQDLVSLFRLKTFKTILNVTFKNTSNEIFSQISE